MSHFIELLRTSGLVRGVQNTFAEMMTMKKLGTLLALSAVSAVAVACSSDPDPGEFKDPNAASNTSGGTPQPCGPLGCNNDKTGDDLKACATSTLDGKTTPVNIIVALDISGSMCEGVEDPRRDCNSTGSKWQLTKKALTTFFKDPTQKDVSASIITWAGSSCSGFDKPVNPANVALPDAANSLVNALTMTPNGGTPTVAAIKGAQAYAQTVQAAKPGEKVVIALATDGEPTDCGSVSQAATQAGATKASGIPVYVIGVGPSLDNLNAIAAGAGTNNSKAFLVQRNVEVEFAKAMQEIKGNSLGCSLKMPVAPAGEKLDLSKVNITFKANTGTVETVPYSQDCTIASGWKYVPSAAAPEGIELCTSACDNVKVNDKGQLSVVLGCATKTGPTK